MAKKNSIFICQTCGCKSAQWIGKCHECNEWNTFIEETIASKASSRTSRLEGIDSKPKFLSEIETESYNRIQTGISEFDRVVGGGIVLGSLILIGGEPGIGKSTLLTSVLAKLSMKPDSNPVLYVSGEESLNQIAERTRRMGIDGSKFLVYHQTDWSEIKRQIEKIKPKVLVIDSIQTTTSPEIQSAPGTVSQIREVTFDLMKYVKANGITCFIIGHITKDGNIAGPKILEHMVDTVVYFEGDQFGFYRVLRAIKNRFGNTNEVGIFEMLENGLKEINNPAKYFLDDCMPIAYGKALSCVLEGSRTLFVEIQALVLESKHGAGKRITQGYDSNRLSMIVAILEKYFNLPLSLNDIFINVVGGIKLNTRDVDLSVMAAILSSYYRKELPRKTIFLGELGLSGEIRSVAKVESRLKEVKQHGFEKVITSKRISNELSKSYSIPIIGLSKAIEMDKYLQI